MSAEERPENQETTPVAATPNEGATAEAKPAEAKPAAPAGEIEGYCVKCKASRTMQNVEMTKTKNGRTMAKGKCPVCGTTMTKFMKG